jgi:hypothetical protein
MNFAAPLFASAGIGGKRRTTSKIAEYPSAFDPAAAAFH